MLNARSRRSRIAHAMSACCVVVLAATNAEDSKDRDAPTMNYAAVGRPESSTAGVSGEELYLAHCSSCHRKNGSGYVTVIPPLATSDYIASDVRRLLAVTMNGLSGPVTVNGILYDGVMPAMGHLSDEELVAVLNYVLNRWNNPGGEITVEDIAAYRRTVGPEGNQPVSK